mgnify:CR=1 FL=1
MMHIVIRETGSRKKNSKEFGYKVLNDVQGYRHLDYENRATRFTGEQYYALEEKIG